MSEPAPERVVRGYVYFFHSTVTHQTKIGCTRRPPIHRFRQVKSNVPGLSVKNAYCFSTDTPHWFERWFHEAFSDRRVQGEWFALTKAELVLLKRAPGYISEVGDIPLKIQVRWIANRVRDTADDYGRVPLRVSPQFAALFRVLTALGATPPEELIVPMMLAECERHLPSLPLGTQAAIRSLVGLPSVKKNA